MNFRSISRITAPALLGLVYLVFQAQQSTAQNFSDVKPSAQQVAWQDMEFGVLIHFGTNTFLDMEVGEGNADPKVFNPVNFDAEQWMKAIKAAGAKYVVLVAKHHDGFCLWPSERTDYSVKNSPWKNGKGDVVREVSNAARKYGLKFGVYLSPYDRHDKRYSADPAAYDEYYLSQIDELSGYYGDLAEFWMDGAGSGGHPYDFARIIQELRIHQPNTLVFADTQLFQFADIRWVGNEDGYVGFENWNVVDRTGYLRWRPAEADTALKHGHWFWHTNSDASVKTLPELMDEYNNTIGKGAQLMLGVAPDNTGLVPEPDVARLVEFGDAIRKLYGHNLVTEQKASGSAEAALDGKPDTFWSAPDGSHSAVIEVAFPKPVTFDRALTMEWLNDGQHVQKYAIEVEDHGSWKTVFEGQAIGHKKIDIFPVITAQKVRLDLLSTTSEAHIREFQLFNGSTAQ
jgi:alpha-L-fucosidase